MELINFCNTLPKNFGDLRLKPHENSPNPKNKVGIAFDKSMVKHYAKSFPERPDRIIKPIQALIESGLIHQMLPLNGCECTEEDILLIHGKDYISKVKNAENIVKEVKEKYFIAVFTCEYTYNCALMSCGTTLVTVDNILNGNIRSGIALVRPPGHHAERDCAYGFCFFNNIAIAAKHAQKTNPHCKVLILDWDVHHGNGTQQAFYEDCSVLFISLHRDEHNSFCTSSDISGHDMVGSGEGAGYNINIPWYDGVMGDAEYLLAFDNIVMPVAKEFDPDLVLVSAGFDAAKCDPLGGYRVSASVYGYMTHKLCTLAKGKVAIILEGGYYLKSVADGVISCTEALIYADTQKCPAKTNKFPLASAVDCVLQTINSLLPYWGCLKESLTIINELKKQMSLNETEIKILKQRLSKKIKCVQTQ